jgi:2-C-methyl-D-erythritol 4-phosphate cytidylyltransferase
VVVPGSPVNFKITTRDDLELAESIVKARLARPTKPLGFADEAKW